MTHIAKEVVSSLDSFNENRLTFIFDIGGQIFNHNVESVILGLKKTVLFGVEAMGIGREGKGLSFYYIKLGLEVGDPWAFK